MHICINKGTVTLVKGDLGLYLENFVLGQIVPVLAILSDLDTYQCTPNEVKLTVPIYDLSTRDFHGLKWIFAYIILRDDDDEVFLRTVLIKKNYLLDSYSKVINDKTIFSKYKGHSVLLISIWFDGSKLQQERLYPLDFIEKLNDW